MLETFVEMSQKLIIKWEFDDKKIKEIVPPELKTLEWDILNPDRSINLEYYLSSRLRKRVDQALLPKSTIQKFPAQKGCYLLNKVNNTFPRNLSIDSDWLWRVNEKYLL